MGARHSLEEEPVKAIACFEDNKDYLKSLLAFLNLYDYRPIIVATTLEEVQSAIAQLEEKQVKAAIVDGNLHVNDVGGTDGSNIVAAIRKTAPSVKTIGNSSREDVEGADFNCPKASGVRKLMETLELIFESVR